MENEPQYPRTWPGRIPFDRLTDEHGGVTMQTHDMPWRLFEPCREDDHSNCVGELALRLIGGRCSCDCHQWDDTP